MFLEVPENLDLNIYRKNIKSVLNGRSLSCNCFHSLDKWSSKCALLCLKSYNNEIPPAQKKKSQVKCHRFWNFITAVMQKVREWLREEVANSTQWLLENAKKGVPKFICKAWMVMSAAQTGLKPTTVTCEMRICGDRTGLNASVRLLSRAYLQRMWEAWHCWRGADKTGLYVRPLFSESPSAQAS